MIESNSDPVYRMHGNRVIWKLPCRDTSRHRRAGWAMISAGAAATAFMLFWIAGPLFMGARMLFGAGQVFGLLPIGFSLLGCMGLLFALRLLLLGRNIVFGRSRSSVEIRGKQLIAIEHVGWFDWRRKVSLTEVDDLSVIDSDSEDQAQIKHAHFLKGDDLHALQATGSEGKFLVVVAYPRAFLEGLAAQIAEHLRGANDESAPKMPPTFVVRKSQIVKEVSIGKFEKVAEPQLPASSRIQIHQHGESDVTFEIPARGIWKGSHGLVAFSAIWLTIVVMIATAAVVSMVQGYFQGEWSGLFVIGLFLLIGLGMLYAAIEMGTSSTMIGLMGENVFIQRKTLFRKRWTEFAQDEVLDVYVNGDGKVNDESLPELRIDTGDAKTPTLLSGLSVEELNWLAFQLRNLLSISAENDELAAGPFWRRALHLNSDLSCNALIGRLPQRSSLQIKLDADALEIRAPAKGLRSMLSGLLAGLLMMGIPVALFVLIDNLDLMLTLILAAIAAAGFGAAWFTIVFSLRRVEIFADPDKLEITRRGILPARKFQWQREAIADIDLEDSGSRFGKQRLYRLHIDATPDLKLLFCWSARELAIIAGCLNKVLSLESGGENGVNPMRKKTIAPRA